MYIFLTQCFPSRLGGIESLVSNLALSLGKKEKVIVFADRHHLFYDAIYDNQYKKHIIVRRISGLKFFRRRKKIKELKSFIESTQVKLVIADTWKSLELAIDYLNKKNVPTLCLAHGNELLFNHIKKSQRIIQTIQKVSYIIANSQYTASLIAELMPKRKNINFVYPGANDLRQIKADNFMQINGDPVLVTLARLEKRKGHAEILKAVKQLKLKFSSIQYIIAGEGPEKLRLQKLVKEYSLESNVSIVGIMNDSQKKYLFENTDLMVMPTLDEREKRIEQALLSAEKAKDEADKVSREYDEIMKKAHSEAQDILAKCKEAGDKLKDEIERKAKENSDKMLDKTKKEIDSEKARAINEIKSATVDLAIKVASKVINKNLDDSTNRNLAKSTINEAN